MIVHPSPDRLRRLAAGGITLGAHLLLLAMLLALGRQHGARREANIPLILVTDPVPPPPIPPRHRAPAPKAAVRAVARTPQPAAPAPPLTAPPPIVPLPLAAPILTGPSGSGTGGAGQGTGGGGGGGGGDGDGTGDGTPPVRIGGRIRDRDYPASLSEAGISGTVSVRYRVGTDGRVSDCTITGSSGSAALDAHTCDLIEQRFRFRPSRDADGRPVPAIIVENHSWLIPAAPPAQARPGGQS